MDDLEKQVFDKIESMRDEIVKFHQEIIQIPSENPPAKYKEVSKFVENKMKEIGLETINKRNNVVGTIGSDKGDSLILYGHMDTVEAFKGWTKDPFGGEIIDDKIYGRGSCDDKSCVTAEIFATKALIDLGIKLNGKLTVTAVIDEETGGMRGAKFLIDKGLIHGNACLLGDGPADYPGGYFGGSLFATFVINGKQSHGMSHPYLKNYQNQYTGVNAIQKMVKILNFLTKLQEEFDKNITKFSNFPDHPSKISHVNLAVIEGGTKISTVPDKCLLHCGIHTIPEQPISTIVKRIEDFIEDIKKEDPDLDIKLTIPIAFEPQQIEEDSRFAEIVKNATKTVYKEERGFRLFICATDAHYFQEAGIPTILLGAGKAECCTHASDEFVGIDDLINTTKMFAISALNYLR